MAIRVMWDDPEQTVLRLSFSPQWTWRELKDSVASAHAMMDTASGPVGLIFDTHQVVMLPDGAPTHVRHLLRHAHPNTRLMIVIETRNPQLNHFGHMLITFLQRYFWLHSPIFYVTTLDEARALLQRHARMS